MELEPYNDLGPTDAAFLRRFRQMDGPARQAFIGRLAHLFARWRALPWDSKARGEQLIELGEALAPLAPSPRVDADETLRRAAQICDRAGAEFRDAVLDLIETATNPAVLRELLDFLADTQITIGEAAAFATLHRLDWLSRNTEVLKTAGEGLVRLAGLRSGVAAQSMVDRLRERGALEANAVHEALRAIASFQPSRLGHAFEAYQAFLLDVTDPEDPKELRPLIRDLAHRAGPTVVLAAIGQFRLAEERILFRATFGGGEDAPCKLVRRFGVRGRDQDVVLYISGQIIPMTALGPLGVDGDFVIRVRDATGARLYATMDLPVPAALRAPPDWFRKTMSAEGEPMGGRTKRRRDRADASALTDLIQARFGVALRA